MAQVDIIWEELIHDLYRNNFILFGEYTLSSGLKSPYYIDLRMALSIPSILRKVTYLYRQEAFKCCSYDAIAGIEVGSIPIAGILAYTMDTPMLYVRKSAKEYATKKYVEGRVEKGWRVLVLEDVSTTGRSIIHAVDKLREVGCEVTDAIVFIDREQGAVERLREMGVRLRPIYTVTRIFEVLRNSGYIDDDKYQALMEYIKSGRDGLGEA